MQYVILLGLVFSVAISKLTAAAGVAAVANSSNTGSCSTACFEVQTQAAAAAKLQ
jgi:hypothetical protein